MQVGNTVIKSFLAVCPSCRREGKARPPRDGWSRRYLCLGCGASWVLLTSSGSVTLPPRPRVSGPGDTPPPWAERGGWHTQSPPFCAWRGDTPYVSRSQETL